MHSHLKTTFGSQRITSRTLRLLQRLQHSQRTEPTLHSLQHTK